MGKSFRSRSRAGEKEDSKLYHSIENDLSKIRENLKIMYLSEKHGGEDFIHGIVRKPDRIKDSLSGYIFDGELAKRVLEGRVSHEDEKI